MVRGAITFLRRKRLWPRETRTPRNPVRVVFLCAAGGRSNFAAIRLSEHLRAKRIRSVLELSYGLKDELDRVGGIRETRRILSAADIIVPFYPLESKLGRMTRRFAPNKRIISGWDYLLDRDFSELFEVINHNFRLKEK